MTQMPPAPGPVSYGSPNPSQNTGMAMGSLICGIVSIVLAIIPCLWFLSVPLGLVAIILAVIARGKIARGEAGGAGAAKGGLITGIIGIILSIVISTAIGLFFRAAGNKLQQEYEKERVRLEQQQRPQQQQRPTTQPSSATESDNP
jgi:hypothetical protein